MITVDLYYYTGTNGSGLKNRIFRTSRICLYSIENVKSIIKRQSMLDAYPSLQNMYKADDGNTEVFYFKGATATFSSFTSEPEVVKF